VGKGGGLMGRYGDEIRSNLERSETNLQAAKELLEKGQYDAAASRAYDAAFHAASALLFDEEINTSEHGDVITLIHRIFVNGRRLTREQGEKLNWLFQLGKSGNSGGAVPLIFGEAQKAVQFAESFFEATKVIISS